MTFKGPVVWLVNSFWHAQDNQKPQQCVNSQHQIQMNKVFQYGEFYKSYRLTLQDQIHKKHTLTHRYGPASESRENTVIVVLTIKIVCT